MFLKLGPEVKLLEGSRDGLPRLIHERILLFCAPGRDLVSMGHCNSNMKDSDEDICPSCGEFFPNQAAFAATAPLVKGCFGSSHLQMDYATITNPDVGVAIPCPRCGAVGLEKTSLESTTSDSPEISE
jgi:predicted RNA-binding Zn-ribbon protein involved in translation (DUF1610 family)